MVHREQSRCVILTPDWDQARGPSSAWQSKCLAAHSAEPITQRTIPVSPCERRIDQSTCEKSAEAWQSTINWEKSPRTVTSPTSPIPDLVNPPRGIGRRPPPGLLRRSSTHPHFSFVEIEKRASSSFEKNHWVEDRLCGGDCTAETSLGSGGLAGSTPDSGRRRMR